MEDIREIVSKPGALFTLSDTKLNATMLAISGDWYKKSREGPGSLVCRNLGKSLVHIDFLRDHSSCKHKPLHFLSASGPDKCRVQSLKVYMSPACSDKHKSMFAELDWIANLIPYPVCARYKVQMVKEDATVITNALEAAPTAKMYRWLCSAAEIDSAIGAVAASINSTCKVRCSRVVMKASIFIESLGRLDDSEFRSRRLINNMLLT